MVRELFSLEELRKYLEAKPSLLAALDIGGTLAKLVLCPPEATNSLSFDEAQFVVGKFPSASSLQIIDLLFENKNIEKVSFIGGGSVRHRGYIEEKSRASSARTLFFGEFEALAKGACILASVEDVDKPAKRSPKVSLVNVGTGISAIEILGSEYKRIGGSCIGGGTFLGLLRAINGKAIDFEDAIKLASTGNSDNCDLLVKDIYGPSCLETCGLSPELVACSMGKVNSECSRADIASSILNVVILSLAQFITSLYQRDRKLLLSGSFFSDSKGHVREQLYKSLAYFGIDNYKVLDHNAYVGCIGAIFCLPDDANLKKL